jgi:hypothetical protein
MLSRWVDLVAGNPTHPSVRVATPEVAPCHLTSQKSEERKTKDHAETKIF